MSLLVQCCGIHNYNLSLVEFLALPLFSGQYCSTCVAQANEECLLPINLSTYHLADCLKRCNQGERTDRTVGGGDSIEASTPPGVVNTESGGGPDGGLSYP